jgi:hypothetical protein
MREKLFPRFFLQCFDFLKTDRFPSHGPSKLYVHVTGSAEEHRFTPEGYHPFYPGWLFASWILMQVFHCSDVMPLYILRTTPFAMIGEQSLFEF